MEKKALKETYKTREIIGGIYKISCTESGEFWIRSAKELDKIQNRFEFYLKTNNHPEPVMRKAWETYGGETFKFEVLEELKKKETQTDRDFKEDIKTLLEMWLEKLEIGQ